MDNISFFELHSNRLLIYYSENAFSDQSVVRATNLKVRIHLWFKMATEHTYFFTNAHLAIHKDKRDKGIDDGAGGIY